MLRRIRRVLAAGIIAAAPIATLAAPGIAHAATYSCTWTGAGTDSNFSTAANWSGCNSAAPQVADTNDLVFPVTAPNLSPVNDLVGATFNSITFNGTGTGTGYSISGTAFTLAGNITDTSDQFNTITNDIAISGATSITTASANLLTLGGNVSGSGSITKSGGSVYLDNTTLTGAITINSGLLGMLATSPADATVSSITVASGATLSFDAFDSSSTSTYTLSTPITSAGTLDFQIGGTASYTLNLTGTLTLNGDTTVLASTGTAVHVKGSLHGPSFKLIDGGAGGSISNDSTDNTTATPSGVLGASTTTPAGSTASSSSAANGTTPGTPDTGFALAANHPVVSLAITIVSAGAILAIARLSRKLSSQL